MSISETVNHLDSIKPHALEGITVVDFTRVLAGPTCTRMLAGAGARIINIKRPGILISRHQACCANLPH